MVGSMVYSRRLLLLYGLLVLCATACARRPGGGRPVGGGGGRPVGGGSNKPGSGGGQHTYPPSNGWSGTSYRPPQQIQHGTGSFPVSQSPPPVYVYQIRDSGSRFNNMYTGLALWNIGRGPYGYRGQPGEVCRFRLVNNGTTEDRRIDCKTISTFIREWENQANNGTGAVVVGNSTVVDSGVNQSNDTGVGEVVITENDSSVSGGVKDALEDTGPSILVAAGMQCYIMRTLRGTTTSQRVDCELLQLYTANSWNAAQRLAPAFMLIVSTVILYKIL